MLDEPFSNLDLPLRDKIFTYIRQQIKKENAAVILVTHQPEEALRYADETAVMENGKLIQHDATFTVYYQPKTKIHLHYNFINKIKTKQHEIFSQSW